MPIAFSCDCGKKLQAPDRFAGKRTKCKACGKLLIIPGATVAGEKVAAVAKPMVPTSQPVAEKNGPLFAPPQDVIPVAKTLKKKTKPSPPSNPWDDNFLDQPTTPWRADDAAREGSKVRGDVGGGRGLAIYVILLLVGAGGGAAGYYWQNIRDFFENLSFASAPDPSPKPKNQPGSGGKSEPTPDQKIAMERLTQIGLAFHMHHDEHKRLPPDKLKGGLSWRVALLPYLGEEEKQLYQQLKMDEPWDSEHNKKLIDSMPSVYASPTAGKGTTPYRVFSNRDAAFDGPFVRFRNFRDGMNSSFLVVEMSDAVPWTKPDDLKFDPKQPPSVGNEFPDVFLALVANGEVRMLPRETPAEVLHDAIRVKDGKLPVMKVK